MSRPLALGLATLLLLVGCSGGGDGTGEAESGQGAESPEAAVSQLIDSLGSGEFPAASPLAIPGQPALASLAEGAAVADVAAALRDGDALIASNFWSGFAQSVEPWLAEELDVVGTASEEAQGVTFDVVTVRTPSGAERVFVTRDVDGARIDLFATFGPSLASRLYPQVESLLESTDADAALVLDGLRDQVPSLVKAAETPGLAPNVVQDILLLVELISRVS